MSAATAVYIIFLGVCLGIFAVFLYILQKQEEEYHNGPLSDSDADIVGSTGLHRSTENL